MGNKKKLPPGQRLICYFVLATCLNVLLGQYKLLGEHKRYMDGCTVPTASPPEPFTLSTEQTDVEAELHQLSNTRDLRTGIFAIDMKTGRFINLHGKDTFAAASMIKVPILVSLLKAIECGDLRWEQKLKIRPHLVTAGSGYLQWRPIGSLVSIRDAAHLMITQSDNTATNLIIDALGGKQAVNEDFALFGMHKTKLNNLLGDFNGTNTTSPYDLVQLMARVEQGLLLTKESRNWMLATMEKTRVRTLLPPGLGLGSKIAHKTGDIGKMVGDVGLVTAPTGLAYLVAVQIERPHNDRRANELIRNISRVIYQAFCEPY